MSTTFEGVETTIRPYVQVKGGSYIQIIVEVSLRVLLSMCERINISERIVISQSLSLVELLSLTEFQYLTELLYPMGSLFLSWKYH